MPAARSRTEHWRECLRKVFDRGGALELSIDRGVANTTGNATGTGGTGIGGSDVVWRCRIMALADDAIHVEPPSAFGATIELQPNVRLIGAMTVGQNRWMFHTRVLAKSAGKAPSKAITVGMPEQVERCTRRSFFRISTANLRLANVQCWPLLDPSTAAAAEAANRAQIHEAHSNDFDAGEDPSGPDSLLLPEVGPAFSASLLNISGGGLGLMLSHNDSAALNSRPFLWLRLDLRPEIPVPIGVTARMAHTHLDSAHNLYAGMAFDFTHNPQHRAFIADLISQYILALQQRQDITVSEAA